MTRLFTLDPNLLLSPLVALLLMDTRSPAVAGSVLCNARYRSLGIAAVTFASTANAA